MTTPHGSLRAGGFLPPEVTTLGAAIRYLRKCRGWTQRDLAVRIGTSHVFVCDLEHDRRKTARLPQIASALGVDLSVLGQLDGRLSRGLLEWLERNPSIVALLERMRLEAAS